MPRQANQPPNDFVNGSGPVSQQTSSISVVIPVYNSMRTLATCLNSVLEALGRVSSSELIVIDNGSTDGGFELLQRAYTHVARIDQIKGRTIASLRNSGARLAQGQYLSFLDSDCVVLPAYFEKAMRVFAQVHPDATGCKYDLPPQPHWIEETWQTLHRRPQDGYVEYLNAGNFIIKREVFEKVGGFDENLATDEDADLGWRLRAAGFRIYEASDVSAVHLGNPKSLRSFFQKEAWHGLGMFNLRKHSVFDKVLLATFLHCCLLLLAVIGIILPRVPASGRLGLALFGLLFVPSLTLAFRFAKLGRVYRPLRCLLLYWIFFGAKSSAMGTYIYRRLRRDTSTRWKN